MHETPPLTFGRRLADLAARAPDRAAIRFLPARGADLALSRAELDRWVNHLARWLEREGAGPGRWVALGVPNEPLHVALALAAWRAGSGVIPVSYRTPAREAERILALLEPAVTIADWPLRHASIRSRQAVPAAAGETDAPLDDRIARPAKGVPSGGSTGAPKVIIDPNPWLERPGGIVARYGPIVGVRAGQIQLLAGPLYHNAPFSWAHYGLFEEHTLVLLERFEAARALDAIAQYRVQWTCLVPTMMQRMLDEQRARPRDLSSLEGVYHTAAPCPAWVKRGWIDLIGAERVFEAYGATEGIGACAIRGDDWLRHEGSVGRPIGCRLAIRDDAGRDLPPGEVGEVFFQSNTTEPPFEYLGAIPRATPDGWYSVGDLGSVDEHGYLYLADRRADLIITGGANVYSAEVEMALGEHPDVRDVVVIGLPDPAWGQRVHAIIEPRDAADPPLADELRAWCRERLVPHKVPKTYEMVTALPRNEAGKIRRAALVAERS